MDFFLSQWASRLPMYHQVCCLLQGVSPLSAARWPVWRTTQNPFSTLSIFILLQMELRGLAPSLHLCPLTFLNHVVHCLPREHHMDGKFPVKKLLGSKRDGLANHWNVRVRREEACFKFNQLHRKGPKDTALRASFFPPPFSTAEITPYKVPSFRVLFFHQEVVVAIHRKPLRSLNNFMRELKKTIRI